MGDHTITLTATDSEQATGSTDISVTIEAPPEQPPTAVISAPVDGASFNEGVAVVFVGSGSDPDGPEQLPESAFAWTSDLDRAIGTGRTFSRSDLSLGNHTITLSVTDEQNLTGTTTVGIRITLGVGAVSYAADIQPYFDDNCVACHAGGTGQEGVNLDSYAAVMAGGDNGDLVVAGDSNQTRVRRMAPRSFRTSRTGSTKGHSTTEVSLCSEPGPGGHGPGSAQARAPCGERARPIA